MDIKTAMLKISFKKDGVDHIWVSPFGGTNLGKFSSLKWRKKFFIPQLGGFISPEAFVSWLFTTNDATRHSPSPNIPRLNQKEFKLAKQALYFAKYHQLSALKPLLIKEYKDNEGVFDIPWIEYKLHQSGVKECHIDTKRVSIIKEMIKHLITKSAKEEFICEDFNYTKAKEIILEEIKERFQIDSNINNAKEPEAAEVKEIKEETEATENAKVAKVAEPAKAKKADKVAEPAKTTEVA